MVFVPKSEVTTEQACSTSRFGLPMQQQSVSSIVVTKQRMRAMSSGDEAAMYTYPEPINVVASGYHMTSPTAKLDSRSE